MFLEHFNLTDDFCQINPTTLEHVALSNTMTFEYHAELAFATPVTVDVTVHFPPHFHLLRLLYYADFKHNVPSPTRDFAPQPAKIRAASPAGITVDFPTITVAFTNRNLLLASGIYSAPV